MQDLDKQTQRGSEAAGSRPSSVARPETTPGPAPPQVVETPRPEKAGTESADDAWYRRFLAKKFPPGDLIRAVGKLHAAGHHDENIALIKAALTTGQSQPWMYDVLPMSMKLAGRPQHEIERALTSRIDFTTTDVSSLLYSAATLSRLDGKQLALDLYRQAARIDPTRAEPYALALKLARKEHDTDATEWACTGILTHVWTKDFQTRHNAAKDAAAETERELFKSGKLDRLAAFKSAMAEALRRDLAIKVEWSGDGDLDLTVKEPLGTSCSVLQTNTASGGLHIHDGFGPRQENCYEEYVCVQAVSGQYQLQIDYVDGKIVSKRCVVTIISHAGSRQQKISRTVVSLSGLGATVPFMLEDGRRKQLAAVPLKEPATQGATHLSRGQLIARVREVGGGPAAAGQVVAQAGAGQGDAAAGAFRLPAGAFTAGIGFQPVVGLINEGVSLTASAVVSPDRRFVRISVAPFFNTLREIQTFSFQGGPPAPQGNGTGQ